MADRIRVSHRCLMDMVQKVGVFYEDPGVRTFIVARGAGAAEQGSPSVVSVSIYEDPPYGDEPDDTLFIAWHDEEGNPKLEAVPVTSQARRRTARRHPTGAIILPPYTIFPYVFHRKVHKGRDAFRAKGWLNYVVRDLDRDGRISAGDNYYRGYFGVNLHGSGVKDGVLSDGCIVWPRKYDGEILKHAYESKQEEWLLTIVEGMDLLRWNEGNAWEQEMWCPSIMFGTRNQWVGRLQECLYRKHGKNLVIDNHWGRQTQAKVEEVLGKDVARMTPELWEKVETEPTVEIDRKRISPTIRP